MKKTLGVLALVAAAEFGFTGYLAAQDPQAEKTLVANERAVMDAVAKGNLAGFKQHVAADGLALDSMSGRMPVSEFMKQFDTMTKEMKLTKWDISDIHTMWIDPNAAVVTYKWTGSGTYQGQPLPSPVWCSTVWSKRNGKWMAVFHQESPAMPMPPAMKK